MSLEKHCFMQYLCKIFPVSNNIQIKQHLHADVTRNANFPLEFEFQEILTCNIIDDMEDLTIQIQRAVFNLRSLN